jgi:hypothetical protein
MQQSPIPARLTGPAYAQVDVFGGDFPAAACRVYTQLGKLHFGVLTVERGDTGIDRNALAHSCPQSGSRRWIGRFLSPVFFGMFLMPQRDTYTRAVGVTVAMARVA